MSGAVQDPLSCRFYRASVRQPTMTGPVNGDAFPSVAAACARSRDHRDLVGGIIAELAPQHDQVA